MTMSSTAQRVQLSEFLKSCRARLPPTAVGLPPAGRRRTPGLRREDVAALAGLSATWYTWLEQGRDVRASDRVLESLSRTLRMSAEERDYLFSLAPAPVGPDPARAQAGDQPGGQAHPRRPQPAGPGHDPAVGRDLLEPDDDGRHPRLRRHAAARPQPDQDPDDEPRAPRPRRRLRGHGPAGPVQAAGGLWPGRRRPPFRRPDRRDERDLPDVPPAVAEPRDHRPLRGRASRTPPRAGASSPSPTAPMWWRAPPASGW